MNFSLQELRKLEAERIAQQKKHREEETARLHRRRQEEKAKALAEAEAMRREEEARATRAREEERLEVARREAMQKAIVEQARLEVDVRARAEERERERQHELELARVTAEAKQKSGAGVVLGSGLVGVALAVAVCAGVFFGSIKRDADQRVADLQQQVTTAHRQTTDLSLRANDRERTIEKLEADLRRTNDELTALKNKPQASPKQPPVPSGTPMIRRPPAPPSPNEPPCTNKFDPLCGHIP